MIETPKHNKDIHHFSHTAMATVYEIFIYSEDKTYAAQAATAAFVEIDRLEQELSFFIENSDVSQINNLSHNDSIIVGIDTFECIRQCKMLYQKTKGAFDITIRPLLELWKKYDYPQDQPEKDRLLQVVKNIGLPWIQLNEESHQVSLMNSSIQIDLGGFGKGYAIDVVKEYLEDWDIQSGLIHSGHSTVSLFGKNPNSINWPLSISDPYNADLVLKKVELGEGSLSGSGVKKGEHIIDPRSGLPVTNTIAAWASTINSGEADALSTAFMVMNKEEISSYCKKYEVAALTVMNDANHSIHYFGNWLV